MIEKPDWRRHRGRWVRTDELAAKTPQRRAAAARPLPGGPRRRVSGRWLPVGRPGGERGGALRTVARRFWLLLIPLVGITYVNSAHVRPVVSEYKSQANLHRKAILDEQDRLKQMAGAVQSEIQTISAEIDTLHGPELRLHQAMYDDLLRTQSEFDRSEKITSQDLDSLRAVRNRLHAEAETLQLQYQNHASILDNLEALRGALRDSLASRERQLAAHEELDDTARDGSLGLKSMVKTAGMVVAPVLGFLWAHSS
jgi:hypothetical protein